MRNKKNYQNLNKDVNNFNYPKFHQGFAHVLECIQKAGSPNNARVGVFEISHNVIKDIYECNTNKKEESTMPQIASEVRERSVVAA